MAVLYGALGGGNRGSTNYAGSVSTSWTHTKAADDNIVIVPLTHWSNGQAPSAHTFSATYGGTAMSFLGTIDFDPNASTRLFYLLNPAAGAQTVTVTANGGTWLGRHIEGNSVSCSGVESISVNKTAKGAGGTLAASGLAANSDDLFVVAFGGWGGITGGITNWDNKYGIANTQWPQSFVNIGTAAGTVTSVSANGAHNPYNSWGIIAAKLTAKPSDTGAFLQMF